MTKENATNKYIYKPATVISGAALALILTASSLTNARGGNDDIGMGPSTGETQDHGQALAKTPEVTEQTPEVVIQNTRVPVLAREQETENGSVKGQRLPDIKAKNGLAIIESPEKQAPVILVAASQEAPEQTSITGTNPGIGKTQTKSPPPKKQTAQKDVTTAFAESQPANQKTVARENNPAAEILAAIMKFSETGKVDFIPGKGAETQPETYRHVFDNTDQVHTVVFKLAANTQINLAEAKARIEAARQPDNRINLKEEGIVLLTEETTEPKNGNRIFFMSSETGAKTMIWFDPLTNEPTVSTIEFDDKTVVTEYNLKDRKWVVTGWSNSEKVSTTLSASAAPAPGIN